MFSKELLELDRNTVQLMIDEMRDEIASNKVQLQEKEAKIREKEAKIREKEAKIQEKDMCIAELEPQLAKNK